MFLKFILDFFLRILVFVAIPALVLCYAAEHDRVRKDGHNSDSTGKNVSSSVSPSNETLYNDYAIQEWQCDEQVRRNLQYMQQIMQEHQQVAEQAMREHQQAVEQTMQGQHQQFSDQLMHDAQQSLSNVFFGCSDGITGFDNLGSGFDDFGGGFSDFGMF